MLGCKFEFIWESKWIQSVPHGLNWVDFYSRLVGVWFIFVEFWALLPELVLNSGLEHRDSLGPVETLSISKSA